MSKNYVTAEEFLSADSFLSWYFKADQREVKQWDRWMPLNSGSLEQLKQAVQFLNYLILREKRLREDQIRTAEDILLQKIRQLDKKAHTPVLSMRGRHLLITAASLILSVTGLYRLCRLLLQNLKF